MNKTKLAGLVFVVLVLVGSASASVWFTNESNFTGTYYQTWLNDSFIQLNLSNSSGWYASPIFDAGDTINWNTITWFDTYGYSLQAEEGMVGLWHLDESSGTNAPDTSGEDHNGTLINMEDGDWITGKFNNGLQFDGINEYVNLGDIANFERNEEFSFEFWFKTSTTSIDVLLDRYGTAKGWTIYLEEGKIVVSFAHDETQFVKKETTNVYNNNNWHHLAVTYDGSSAASGIIIYVDGEVASTTTLNDLLTDNMQNNDVNCSLGSRGNTLYYDGMLDEVVIYNKTVLASDILEHYLNGTNQLNISVRSCDDAACSGDAWNESYSTSPHNINVVDNRWFQYNASLATDNQSYTPKLWNVSIAYGVPTEDCINITLYFVSATNLPIGNILVTLRNTSNNNTVSTNTTDNVTGAVTFYNVDSFKYPATGVNFISEYPSSGYTASLINESCPSFVYLNGFSSMTVIVTNTLGEYLEAQDGRVYVTEAADTSVIIKEYDTQCKTDEPYLDGDGNWASYSGCPFSDSMGRYVYKFDVLEKDDYEYNQNYTIHAIINGKEATCNFTTILPKHADTDKYEDMAKQWSGLVSLFVFLVVIALILYLLWKKK